MRNLYTVCTCHVYTKGTGDVGGEVGGAPAGKEREHGMILEEEGFTDFSWEINRKINENEDDNNDNDNNDDVAVMLICDVDIYIISLKSKYMYMRLSQQQ